mgnify:CR=1 FL=1
MEGSKKLKLSAEVIVNNAEEAKIVLFRSADNSGFVVDGLAALVCLRMDGKKSLTDIMADLRVEVEAELPTLEADVRGLVVNLENYGLVESAESAL